MFRCLAPWPRQTLCRIYLQQRAHLSQLPPRVSWQCYGWQSRCKGRSLRFRFPDPRGASIAWAQVQYFSTAGSSKDGPKTDEVLSAQSPKEPTGSKPLNLPNAESIQVKVGAVLKKREYGTKYTQNNFITAVRAMNEFCLKPRALDVWGSMEALARERNLRKDVERQFQERMKLAADWVCGISTDQGRFIHGRILAQNSIADWTEEVVEVEHISKASKVDAGTRCK
ncbi:hypothetical protein HF521_018738 [Silurus meridionalis]|uniref:Uncharacterized protein n=1 Tax=Silurus meridionalis TaxID=175797 RepID=A0A8T0BQ86_SILME|nr:hypothetical protein HF521_018738 [Silurus meridionalis]